MRPHGLTSGSMPMGIGSGGAMAFWIFIHNADKVDEGGL